MPRRDRSAEAVAREWLGSNGPETVFVGDLASLIEFDRRAERARVRRIVRRELARRYAECIERAKEHAANEKYNNEVYYRARADEVVAVESRILAALREGKGAKG